jgi:hypothetical protein
MQTLEKRERKMRHKSVIPYAMLLALGTFPQAGNADDIFIVRTTSKTPAAVVSAIKSYSEQKKWQYLGNNKVKKGEVTLVKICIPEVGRLIWPAGLRLSAMLPCGNVGIYQKDAATEISVLHPRYMHRLHPHPATKRAGEVAQPLLTDMLDTVTK